MNRQLWQTLSKHAGLVAIATTFAWLWSATDNSSWIGQHVESAMGYRAASLVNQPVQIDPRLKIIALDDGSYGKLQRPSLSSFEWFMLVAGLRERGASAIFIDAMFGYQPTDEPNFGALPRGGPVIAGAFAPRRKLPGRSPISAGQIDDTVAIGPGADQVELPLHAQAYAHHPEFATLIDKVGHFQQMGQGLFQPILRYGDQYLPHISLHAASDVALVDGEILVDRRPMPLDHHGLVQPRLLTMGDLRQAKRLLPMAAVLQTLANGNELTPIESGDVVVILPYMYTGNVDFKDTPRGRMPGGLIVAATINDALGQSWVQPLPRAGWFGMAVLALLLSWLVTRIPVGLSRTALSAIVAMSIAGAGIALFAFANYHVPWFSAAALYLGATIANTLMTANQLRSRQRQLRAVFHNLLPKQQLDQLLANPEGLEFNPVQRLVSIMFIDVVGFSKAAERQIAESTFFELRELLGAISHLVHQHGGVVDKTLGDGMMAFFGYDYTGKQTEEGHADLAVQCALAIQRQVLEFNRKRAGEGKTIHPLRIGINSESVFIGNLGDDERPDFTLIGNGVNYAKRLEEACEVYKILVADTTTKIMLEPEKAPDLQRRLIAIKHHQRPFEAFEVNPFADRAQELKESIDAYWHQAGISIQNPRNEVAGKGMSVSSEYGRGLLLDISPTGLSFDHDTFLGRGMTVELKFEDPALAEQVQHIAGESLSIEIKWGKAERGRYVHGGLLKNLNRKQLQELNQLLAGDSSVTTLKISA